MLSRALQGYSERRKLVAKQKGRSREKQRGEKRKKEKRIKTGGTKE
jgi:hypothetical protein